MSVDEAIIEFAILCLTVFGKQAPECTPQERMSKLEGTVKNLLRRRGLPIHAKLFDPERTQTKCLG
jgi:hypothetical protein